MGAFVALAIDSRTSEEIRPLATEGHVAGTRLVLSSEVSNFETRELGNFVELEKQIVSRSSRIEMFFQPSSRQVVE